MQWFQEAAHERQVSQQESDVGVAVRTWAAALQLESPPPGPVTSEMVRPTSGPPPRGWRGNPSAHQSLESTSVSSPGRAGASATGRRASSLTCMPSASPPDPKRGQRCLHSTPSVAAASSCRRAPWRRVDTDRQFPYAAGSCGSRTSRCSSLTTTTRSARGASRLTKTSSAQSADGSPASSWLIVTSTRSAVSWTATS